MMRLHAVNEMSPNAVDKVFTTVPLQATVQASLQGQTKIAYFLTTILPFKFIALEAFSHLFI